MARIENIIACAAAMSGLWGLAGLSMTLRLFPRSVALFFAPALGWAVYSVIALALCSIVGLTRTAALLIAALVVIASSCAIGTARCIIRADRTSLLIVILVLGAALLAMAPAAAVVPKIIADSVRLATPIFDHSKIALIDEMIRSGVPPTNPFFSEVGTTDRVAYYYLWHFSAANIALMTGASGWEADAALTWFTGFSSLLLAMGIARWLSRDRVWPAAVVLLVAATSSLRLPLIWLVGADASRAAFRDGSGFGGWLFQTSWAPQHVASAACAVLVALMLPRLADRPRLLLSALTGCVVAASFQSSIWVGGVTLALASAIIVLDRCRGLDAKAIRAFVGQVALTVGTAAALSAPLLFAQAAVARLRGDGLPIGIRAVNVFGDAVGPTLRAILDIPAYWVLYLPLELPAYYLAGGAAILTLLRRHEAADGAPMRPLLLLLATSLAVAWLMVSTIGNNNDLGWRAVLPAVLLLAAFAAAGFSVWSDTRSGRTTVFAGVVVLLGLPEGIAIIKENLIAEPAKSERLFAMTPRLWQAVRQHLAPQERLANNPRFLADMTSWPINISWALLADRRSCFAGADLALPFAPVPRARRREIEQQFDRVFAGQPQADDVEQFATRYDCTVVVVTPQDLAWSNDPFASTPYYGLVENQPDAWRIYRKSTTDKRRN